MTRRPVDLYRTIDRQTACRIGSAAENGICRITEDRTVTALDISNLSVDEGRSEPVRGPVGTAADPKNASIWWIATRICKKRVGQTIKSYPAAASDDKLAFTQPIRTPCKTKLGREIGRAHV